MVSFIFSDSSFIFMYSLTFSSSIKTNNKNPSFSYDDVAGANVHEFAIVMMPQCDIYAAKQSMRVEVDPIKKVDSTNTPF